VNVFSIAKQRLPDKLKELRKPKAEVGTFADGRLKYESETRNGYTSPKNRLVKLAPLSVAKAKVAGKNTIALPAQEHSHPAQKRHPNTDCRKMLHPKG
jgi:hypothetical protein